MKRILVLLVVGIFISVSFINCGDDAIVPPEINKEPAVNISSPDDGSSFTGGAIISFAGTGEDYHGTALPDSLLVWISDQDDTIGTGTSFDRDDLSVNTHVITLTGSDGDGNTDSESITISIREGAELISVPATAGYPMGWDEYISGHEEPVHTVALNAFRIGKYEVTYALWMVVKTWADANGYIINDGVMGDGSDRTDQHPVTDIHWKDCIAWCNAYSEKEGLTPVYYTSSAQTALYKDASTGGDGNISSDCVNWSANGFRLPTEAEWEYAARYTGGSSVSPGDKHCGYNLDPDIDNCAWFRDNSISSSEPVGQLQANSLGAHDMSGNVSEWCWDWYDGNYYNISPVNNPHGPASGVFRINRGGGWGVDSADIYAYSAYRAASNPFFRHLSGGFRVCRNGAGD